MDPENLTVRVLMDIRDEMRGLRGDVTDMREEVRGLRTDVVDIREEVRGLRSEVTHIGERLALTDNLLVDVGGQLRMMGRSMGVTRAAKRRHETRLDALELRVSELERKR